MVACLGACAVLVAAAVVASCALSGAGLEAGIVWANCWMVRDLRTPFGGAKQSGVGREGGLEAAVESRCAVTSTSSLVLPASSASSFNQNTQPRSRFATIRATIVLKRSTAIRK